MKKFLDTAKSHKTPRKIRRGEAVHIKEILPEVMDNIYRRAMDRYIVTERRNR